VRLNVWDPRGALCRAKGYNVTYSDEVDRQMMIVGCKVTVVDQLAK
jgi:hypothetical protein